MHGKVVIENARGQPIRSVDDWFRLAPPQGGAEQWVDGRSAKELAKVWFRRNVPSVPDELRELLAAVDETRDLEITRIIAEKITRLDEFDPGHRNHDLTILGKTREGQVLIAVEAKADESFVSTIAEALRAAEIRVGNGTTGKSSNLPKRVAELCTAVLGCEPRVAHEIRYQLLYGLAGALIEAKAQAANRAVFLVHEFVTDRTKDEIHARNRRDLERFAAHFGLQFRPADSMWAGPIQVPGGKHVPGDIPIWLAKIVTRLRSAKRAS